MTEPITPSNPAPTVVVGAGLAGLVTGKILENRGIEWIGLDRAEAPGGAWRVGSPRLFDAESASFFKELVPGLEVREIEEPARERRKGEWVSPSSDDLSDDCRYFLGEKFLHCVKGSPVKNLSQDIAKRFRFRAGVEKILSNEKKIRCTDGTEVSYEKLYWCADIGQLLRLWDGEKVLLMKALKETEEIPGGISWHVDLKEPLFENLNSVVFAFRHKDRKLRAYGVSSQPDEASIGIDWFLYLEEDLAVDREETAKLVRAMKRELQKEFPRLKDLTLSERIVHLPAWTGGPTGIVKNLEVLPDVVYVGSQLKLADSPPGLRDWDLTLANCRWLDSSTRKDKSCVSSTRG